MTLYIFAKAEAAKYLNSLKLSDDYCSALVNAIQDVLDSSHAKQDLSMSKIPMKMELAKAKLRGARSKAKFDDLYKLDYEGFEEWVLLLHQSLLFEACVPRRHRLLITDLDRKAVISKV